MANGRILGGLLRAILPDRAIKGEGLLGYLFQEGGDVVLPAQPARAADDKGNPALPAQPAVTVTVPHGVARDPAVIIKGIGILYILARVLGWEPPVEQELVTSLAINVWDAGVLLIEGIAAIVARIKSRNLTR